MTQIEWIGADLFRTVPIAIGNTRRHRFTLQYVFTTEHTKNTEDAIEKSAKKSETTQKFASLVKMQIRAASLLLRLLPQLNCVALLRLCALLHQVEFVERLQADGVLL